MGRSPSRSSRQAPRRRKPAALFAFEKFIQLSGVGAVVALGYFLYLIFSEGAAQAEQQARWMQAASIFIDFAWLLAICLFARYWRQEVVALWIGIAGAAIFVALPITLSAAIPEEILEGARFVIRANVQRTGGNFVTLGTGLVALAVLHFAIGRIIRLSLGVGHPSGGAVRPVPAAKPAGTLRPSLLRRCWELSECRESFRQACPRFHDQVSCWRKRSGCYCDKDLATRLLRAAGLGHRGDIEQEMTSLGARAEQRARESLSFTLERARRKAARRVSLCGECPVYLDHQGHKYRLLTWIVYPAAAVLLCLAYPFLKSGYNWAYTNLGAQLGKFQWLAPNEYALGKPLSPGSAMGDTVFIALVGLILVSFLLQGVEYFVYRLKW